MSENLSDSGLENGRLVGRSAVGGVYERRRALGCRTTAHLVQNFSLVSWDEYDARTRAFIVVYAALGGSPVPSGPPALITSSDSRCAKADEGRWLVAERINQVLHRQPSFRFSHFENNLPAGSDGGGPR